MFMSMLMPLVPESNAESNTDADPDSHQLKESQDKTQVSEPVHPDVPDKSLEQPDSMFSIQDHSHQSVVVDTCSRANADHEEGRGTHYAHSNGQEDTLQ